MENNRIINFTATDERLDSGCPGGYPSDSVAWIRAEFELGTGWSDFQSVRAVWQNGVTVISTVLDANGACTVPWEVLQYRGTVMVNLVGSDAEGDELIDRLTTFRIPAVKVTDKVNVEGSETVPVTPSQFEQFVSIVADEARAAQAAQEAAESARDAAAESAGAAAISEANALLSEAAAEAARDEAVEAAEKVTGMTAEATTLTPGSDATAEWDGDDGVLRLGIPRGDTGATGPVGPTGPQGPTGPTGATGNGIESVTLVSTSGAEKTYRITFTDGTHFDYVVTDGEVTNASLASALSAFLDTTLTVSGKAADAKAVGDELTYVKSELNDIVGAYTSLRPYLEKVDAYITTSGTYTTLSGVNTYHIPLDTLDICRFAWDTDFWGSFPVGSVFTVKKSDDTYERVTGYKKYGAFYSSGKECIICAIQNVTDVYIVVPQGNESRISLSVNIPSTQLTNDVKTSKILSNANAIHTNYYIGLASFNYFNSPYGSYFIKMSQGDKLIINKTLTGISGVGFIAVADGTATNIAVKEYTASTDCIFCAFDKTDVLGDFTFIPYDSLKIASKDIIGDVGKSPFYGFDGVAFGTSLTYRAISAYGFLTKLSDLSGITFDNQGVGSSYIYGDGGSLDMLVKIKSYTSYANKRVCLLEGFVNDWYGNRPLGTYTDTTETSVCGCVRSAVNYMLSQNASLTIFLVLDHYGRNNSGIDCSTAATNGSGKTQFEFYEEIAKVAESLGIPVIKEYAISQISENTPQYLADNIHCNALGAEQSANAIWSQMKQYYPNEK